MQRLNGLADLHCHILPGVDDGSDCIETSLEMLELSAESGVTDLVCTPHCIPGYYENYKGEKLNAKFDKLKQAAKDAGIPVNLHLGMEVYGHGNTFQDIKNDRLCTIAGSKYMLVEFNFGERIDVVQNVIDDIADAGFIPVIAHPERYKFVAARPALLYDWADRGFPLQSNKDSINGKFGRLVYEIVMDMLSDRLVSAVASDAHSSLTRTPYLGYAYNAVEENFGKKYAELIFCENPHRIINNDDVI